MLTTKQLVKWLNPWPIKFKGECSSKWALKVLTLTQAEKLSVFWKVNDSGLFRSVRWWACQAAKYKMPVEQHYIHMLAKYRVPLLSNFTVIVIWREKEQRWVVVDGNHHLAAVILAGRLKWQGLKSGITHIGVMYRKESKRRFPYG